MLFLFAATIWFDNMGIYQIGLNQIIIIGGFGLKAIIFLTMYSPNLGRPMVIGEDTKKHDIHAPHVQRTSRCSILRGVLLGWAFLRLVVSVLWTGLLIIGTFAPYWSPEHREQPGRLTFGAVAIILQLVEFGMIVTFITAGVKKSANLYGAYYRYCILTLITYITAVMLCLALDYDSGHYLGEIYLTYHISDFIIVDNDALVFVSAAIVDIGLEVLLILSVKFLIKEYSSNQNYATAENV